MLFLAGMVIAPVQRMRFKANGLAFVGPTIGGNFGFNLRSQEEGNVSNALINKLSGHAPLSAEDTKLLEAACGKPQRVPARHDLIREGDKPGPIIVMLEGWACRYKMLPEGSRQITAFLMPGDCFDMHASVLEQMEHTIATLTPARVAMIPRTRMEELILTRPALTRAFWWAQLVDEDTLRAWIVSMGRRNSLQRVAHLMCELYVRAHSIGLTADNRFQLPLTQVVLGDALGLTAVHINRVLRKLRVSGVMELTAGSLIIADISRLARVAGFDDNYLHRRLRRTA
jgi:CRP-like cAMP-binding protein